MRKFATALKRGPSASRKPPAKPSARAEETAPNRSAIETMLAYDNVIVAIVRAPKISARGSRQEMRKFHSVENVKLRAAARPSPQSAREARECDPASRAAC